MFISERLRHPITVVYVTIADFLRILSHLHYRAESSHSALKRYLQSAEKKLHRVFSHIHDLLEKQHCAFLRDMELSRTKVSIDPDNFYLFRIIHGKVSQKCIDILEGELERGSGFEFDETRCGCVMLYTHGLPCAHLLHVNRRLREPIEMNCIHSQWQTLDVDQVCNYMNHALIEFYSLCLLVFERN